MLTLGALAAASITALASIIAARVAYERARKDASAAAALKCRALGFAIDAQVAVGVAARSDAPHWGHYPQDGQR